MNEPVSATFIYLKTQQAYLLYHWQSLYDASTFLQ